MNVWQFLAGLVTFIIVLAIVGMELLEDDDANRQLSKYQDWCKHTAGVSTLLELILLPMAYTGSHIVSAILITAAVIIVTLVVMQQVARPRDKKF